MNMCPPPPIIDLPRPLCHDEAFTFYSLIDLQKYLQKERLEMKKTLYLKQEKTEDQKNFEYLLGLHQVENKLVQK